MTRGQAFPSKYLSKDDVPAPVVATIGEVRIEVLKGGEHGDENKAVMHFAANQLKPMILNQGNWMTLEDRYGAESDGWRGKQIEVYVDPNVMFGSKRVGGLRLRAPMAVLNGAHGALWTFDTAVLEASKVGLGRGEVIAAVKKSGGLGWSALRDTPIIQTLIAAAATQEQGFDDVPAPAVPVDDYGDSIPF